MIYKEPSRAGCPSILFSIPVVLFSVVLSLIWLGITHPQTSIKPESTDDRCVIEQRRNVNANLLQITLQSIFAAL